MVQIVAESSKEEGQLSSLGQRSTGLGSMQHDVGCLQDVARMGQIVVGVVIVARRHTGDEGRQAPVLQPKCLHHARVCEDVEYEAQLHVKGFSG